MSPQHFLTFMQKVVEEDRREEIKKEWFMLYPHMAMGLIKMIPFSQYYDQRTGKNIDLRPASEIIAEIEELHRKAKEEK